MTTTKKKPARKAPKQPRRAKAAPAVLPIDSDPDPAPGSPEALKLCHAEIAAILGRYGCRLIPYMQDPQRVGDHGGEVLIRATLALVPSPPNPQP